MVYHDLVLDRHVRDWVLVPLTLSILLMMMLRQYLSKLMMGGKSDAKVEMSEVREKQALQRSGILRAHGGFLTDTAYRQRKQFFIAKDVGVFSKKSEAKSAQEMMMTNPDIMMNMMKQNLTGFLPQIVMGTFVNYFFSGFILGKVPFPLSPSFRPMLQRGIDLPTLDVSYYTSLSYYILLLFGLRGVFVLMFREDTIDDTQMMRQQMAAMGGGAGGMPMETQKAFDGERAALDLTDYKFRLEGAEQVAANILRHNLQSSQSLKSSRH